MSSVETLPLYVKDIGDVDPADTRHYGGKATGLARMAVAGIAIPPAFVIGTAGFRAFQDNHRRLPDDLRREVREALSRLERTSGKRFAGGAPPLLVSVRSGAQVSMPGMMDTVLNLGIEARSAVHLARSTGSAAFALDTWMRFWRMFGDTVLGIEPDQWGRGVEAARLAAEKEPGEETFLALERSIVDAFHGLGEEVEADPGWQLDHTIGAVFRSWDSARAKAYRRHHAIADDLGTSVTIQAMVFGNMDAASGSGVAFTRNPNSGERVLYGEYLTGRQGEDLVAGTHTPIDLSDPAALAGDLRRSLVAHGETLERLYRDAVDIEFTVESAQLYLLQVRPAKRTAAAAVRIAVDLVAEGLLTPAQALGKVSAEQLKRLTRPGFDDAAMRTARVLTSGLGSSPGQAQGAAVLDSDRAAERAGRGEAVILLRPTTSPLDIRGMLAANGIVTAKGGALSHAAVVSRALDKPCIVGCDTIALDLEARTFRIGEQIFHEGEPISVDGHTGKVFAGAIPLHETGSQAEAVNRLLQWADAASGAAISVSTRGAGEMRSTPAVQAHGFGVIGLTDLIAARGDIDRFTALVSALGTGQTTPRGEAEIGEIVYGAARDAIAASRGLPLDLRLPRITSERARRMIEDWHELTPRLFLPLGMPSYQKAMLKGLAQAVGEAGGGPTTVFLGGITSLREAEGFEAIAKQVGGLRVGVMLQNPVAAQAGPAIAQAMPVWIDIGEIIRNSLGFPVEVLDARAAMQAYVAEGRLPGDPLTALPPLVAALMEPLGRLAGAEIGVDCGSTCEGALVCELYRLGFRKFSVPLSRHNEIRLLLGQQASE